MRGKYIVCLTNYEDGYGRCVCTTDSLEEAVEAIERLDHELVYEREDGKWQGDEWFSIQLSEPCEHGDTYVVWINTEGDCRTSLPEDDPRWEFVKDHLSLSDYCVCVTHGNGSPEIIHRTNYLADAIEYMAAMEDPDYTYDNEEDAEYDDVLYSTHIETPYNRCVAWINTDGKCGTDLSTNDPRWKLAKEYLRVF